MQGLALSLPMLNIPLSYISHTMATVLRQTCAYDPLKAYNIIIDQIASRFEWEDPEFGPKFEIALYEENVKWINIAVQKFNEDYANLNKIEESEEERSLSPSKNHSHSKRRRRRFRNEIKQSDG